MEYTAEHFRDEVRQRQFRRRYEVGHIVALQIAAKALNNHRSQGRPPIREIQDVTDVVNSDDNLRLVSADQNAEEGVLDEEIIRKAEKIEPGCLSDAADGRAREQVAIIQKHQDQLHEGTYDCFRNFYKSIKTRDGRTLWDMRRD